MESSVGFFTLKVSYKTSWSSLFGRGKVLKKLFCFFFQPCINTEAWRGMQFSFRLQPKHVQQLCIFRASLVTLQQRKMNWALMLHVPVVYSGHVAEIIRGAVRERRGERVTWQVRPGAQSTLQPQSREQRGGVTLLLFPTHRNFTPADTCAPIWRHSLEAPPPPP